MVKTIDFSKSIQKCMREVIDMVLEVSGMLQQGWGAVRG